MGHDIDGLLEGAEEIAQYLNNGSDADDIIREINQCIVYPFPGVEVSILGEGRKVYTEEDAHDFCQTYNDRKIFIQ